jgi:hypothetical protein
VLATSVNWLSLIAVESSAETGRSFTFDGGQGEEGLIVDGQSHRRVCRKRPPATHAGTANPKEFHMTTRQTLRRTMLGCAVFTSIADVEFLAESFEIFARAG